MHSLLPRIAALAVFASILAVAADWPQFRGPGGQGVAQAKNLPASWSDTENLQWKTGLPGPGASSPIVVGKRVIVTCYSGYGLDGREPGDMQNLRLHVICVDHDTGKVLWDTELKPVLPETQKVRDHGYAAATPACDGEYVYTFFGKSGVAKLDLNGKKIWQKQVGSGLHGWGSGTSPVLYRNLVIVNASVESRSLVALDKASGEQVWRAGGMNASWNTPHLVALPGGKQELVVSVKDRVLAYDPATGKQLWSCEGIHDYVCPSIVSDKGVVYAIGGRRSQAVAIKAGGSGDVTGSHQLWRADVGANVSSPVVVDGHLYWVSDRNQTAYCLSTKDGNVVYAERVGQPYASTVAADGKLYVVFRQGGAVVLPAKPEFKVLSRNRFSDRSIFDGSPAVSADRIFLRSDQFLYCIAKK
jgi:outer membrane protein assembly factor BamB